MTDHGGRDDGRDRYGMCLRGESFGHCANAMTRADTRYLCMWRHGKGGSYRNGFPTLAQAEAHLAQHPEWGPDHVYDMRHMQVASVYQGQAR